MPPRLPPPWGKGIRTLLLLAAAVFFLLRFVHLTADYPRNIRWDDGIATDEGWYASSAVNAHTWGVAILPGDMNIPVLMPVWPDIANAVFAIGGFHITTLRATAVLFFALCVLLGCVLLRRYGAKDWVPLFVALLVINPWSFAFSRSAFLEFPMVAFCLLAAIVGVVRKPDTGNVARLLLGGAIFAVAILLKTTAAVLAPVFVYMLWEAREFHLRRAVRDALLFFAATALVYAPYWFLRIRTHRVDVEFYLSVVQSMLHYTLRGFIADATRPFRYGAGSDHLLFAVAMIAIAVSFLWSRARTLWRDPLFALSGVWLITFLGFMIKHNNDPARYFAVTLIPVLFVAIALLRNANVGPRVRQVLLASIVLDLCVNATQIGAAMVYPAYTYRDAAVAVEQIVRGEPGHSQVVIGDEVHEAALQNGLRPVNLLFHSATITQQMERYQPGWWLQFGPIDDGACFRAVLSKAYTAERRGEWTIFYPGQRLVLWKLEKIPGTTLPRTFTSEQTAACTPPQYK